MTSTVLWESFRLIKSSLCESYLDWCIVFLLPCDQSSSHAILSSSVSVTCWPIWRRAKFLYYQPAQNSVKSLQKMSANPWNYVLLQLMFFNAPIAISAYCILKNAKCKGDNLTHSAGRPSHYTDEALQPSLRILKPESCLWAILIDGCSLCSIMLTMQKTTVLSCKHWVIAHWSMVSTLHCETSDWWPM